MNGPTRINLRDVIAAPPLRDDRDPALFPKLTEAQVQMLSRQRGLSTALLDAVAVGGQAATSARIENYLGFPAGISGAELAERARLQATKFRADIMVPRRAVALGERDGFHLAALEDGDELVARSVILALGVQYRRLPIPGLADYEGIGVAYAVDVARAQLESAVAAVVVGGANSAGQAALTLAEEGHRVFLVVRGPSLAQGMARYLRERLAPTPRSRSCSATRRSPSVAGAVFSRSPWRRARPASAAGSAPAPWSC
jgi:thioredoxin reductase